MNIEKKFSPQPYSKTLKRVTGNLPELLGVKEFKTRNEISKTPELKSRPNESNTFYSDQKNNKNQKSNTINIDIHDPRLYKKLSRGMSASGLRNSTENRISIEFDKYKDPIRYGIMREFSKSIKTHKGPEALEYKHKRIVSLISKTEKDKITESERLHLKNFVQNKEITSYIEFRTLMISDEYLSKMPNPPEDEYIEKAKIRGIFKNFDEYRIDNTLRIKDITRKYENDGEYIKIGKSNLLNNERTPKSMTKSSSDMIQAYSRYENKKKLMKIRALGKHKNNLADFIEKLVGYLLKIELIGLTLEEITSQKIFSTYPYQKEGSFAFMKAVKANNTETVLSYLKYHKYLVYDFDENWKTALHWAVIKQHESLVEILLEFGSDFDSLDDESNTPLYYAIKGNNFKLVNMLLYRKANPWSPKNYDRYLDLPTSDAIKHKVKLARKINISLGLTNAGSRSGTWKILRKQFSIVD